LGVAKESIRVSNKPEPLGEREFERILLIKLSALGDVIHTIPLLNALRRRYPAARIDWLLKPSVAELIRLHPAVSNVLVYGENHTEAPRYNWEGVTHWLGLMLDQRFLGMLRGIRRARYDLVIDVHCQMRTAFVTLVSGAPTRIGFGKPQPEVWQEAGKLLPEGTIQRSWKGAREVSWLAYTHHIPLPTLDVHAVDRYLSAGRMLGTVDTRADFDFPISPAIAAKVDRLLEARGIPLQHDAIVLAPAALWETKRWQPEGFAEVARHFIRAGRPVVLIGSKDERPECEQIAAAAPGTVDLAGQTTLVELAALLKRAAICLTNDSGPMHMAVALDKPVASVFGPTNPDWIGPYGRYDAVLRSRPACSPCYLRNLSRCNHRHACMTEVPAADVIHRMETMLQERAAALR
jgi:heptosyltransferase-1